MEVAHNVRVMAKRELRVDAVKNREAIVRAARQLFAKNAREVAMDEIARRAKVSRATLYRNFVDIDALASELFEENIVAIERAIEDAGDARGSFERVLILTVEEGLTCRALIPTLAARAESKQIRELSMRVARVLGIALARAQARGEAREDLDAEDMIQVLAMIFSTVLANPRAKDLTARTRRSLGFVLDGLRPRS